MRGVVAHVGYTLRVRAMGAAVDLAAVFDAVADDPTTAVAAHRSELVNRALEGVKGVLSSVRDHFEAAFVIVSADVASGHGKFSGGEACISYAATRPGSTGLRQAHRRLANLNRGSLAFAPGSLASGTQPSADIGRYSSTQRSRNGLRTILVVDDEAVVTATIQTMLIPHGFRVLIAHSASEALGLAESEPVHMIISDVLMPGLQGPALLAQLHARGINVPVLFISGDLELSTIGRALEVDRATFLPKPFSLSELLQAVWARLGE